MSKEYLESLEKIKQEFNCDPEYYGLGGAFEILESALYRLESIDNAEPSEALKCLEKVYSRLPQWDLSRNVDQCNIIKQALIKAEKEHNSVNLLMQELDCKDFADLRKYARCGYEKLKSKEIS